MEIYVGYLAETTTEEDLFALFKPFGQVHTALIKRELFSGVSKGFAFVEMPGRQHSLAAISGLNGKSFNGQTLRVNEAQPSRGRVQRRR